MRKEMFVRSALETVTQLATALERAEKLMATWFARGYGDGNTNEFVEYETQPFGITPADLQNVMYLLDSFLKYSKGEDTPKVNFKESIAKYRNDV